MARDKLSKRQMAIYEYICTYTKEKGYPPSVREIGSAVGLASPSTVHMHLKVLQERGFIKRDSKKPRTIEVVSHDEAAPQEQPKVVSPIGLDIGAESPAEIAVSIAAQLIMVRAGKGAGPKDWKA